MFNLFKKKNEQTAIPVGEHKPIIPNPVEARWELTATTDVPVAEPEAISVNETPVQIFTSEFGSIRVALQGSDPWFAAKDVATALGYSDTAQAVRKHVDEKDKGVVETTTPGGKQPVTFINESGLYSLIFSSKLPAAKEFTHWVTSEVLPSIRKHGAYMTATTIESIIRDPASFVKLAQALADEQAKSNALSVQNVKLITANSQLEWENDGLSQKIEQDAPKVLFADSFVRSGDNISIAEMAKVLQDHGFETGPIRLFEQFRKDGFLISEGSERNLPTHYAMNGLKVPLFTIEKYTYTRNDGKEHVATKVLVTPRGQAYFLKRYCGDRFESADAKQKGKEILLTRTECAALARQKRKELAEECADVITAWCNGNSNVETLWREMKEIRSLVGIDEDVGNTILGIALRSVGCQVWKRTGNAVYSFPTSDNPLPRSVKLVSVSERSTKEPTNENGVLSSTAPINELVDTIKGIIIDAQKKQVPFQLIAVEPFKAAHKELANQSVVRITTALHRLNVTATNLDGVPVYKLPA